MSKEISEVSNKPSKRRVRYGSSKPSYTLISPKSSKSQMETTVKSNSVGNTLQQGDSSKMEPLLIITPHHDISDNNRNGPMKPTISYCPFDMLLIPYRNTVIIRPNQFNLNYPQNRSL